MPSGTLEGIESCYDSEGLGWQKIDWTEPPAVGQLFVCSRPGYYPFHTGTVQSMKEAPDGTISFRTKRTTYILRPEATDAN